VFFKLPFEGEGSRRLKIQFCFEDHIFRSTDGREHFPEDELILGENRLLLRVGLDGN